MSEPITVSRLNQYVAALLDKDENLNPVLVKGEISGFKAYPSGHWYFTLKDEKAAVSCVMFKGYNNRLDFRLENGHKVIVTARASLYDRDGRFQLIVMDVTSDGLGALYLAFEQLKKKLESEGLFDPAHKKKIPLLPTAIGVVTSPAGAVIRDIIQVLSRRYPNFRLKLMPVAVQGAGAAEQIAHAIQKMNEYGAVDVLIVGRGGGSLEDLWPFNEECVARAVYQSGIPVISAVGHETDFTICDFAADLRAPTPSAAAELAMPIRQEQEWAISQMTQRMVRALNQRLEVQKKQVRQLKERRVLRQPMEIVDSRRMDLDRSIQALRQAMKSEVNRAERSLSIFSGKLDALSPLKVLARGYGVVRQVSDQRALISTALVHPGDQIDVYLSDGSLRCDVKEVIDRRLDDPNHE